MSLRTRQPFLAGALPGLVLVAAVLGVSLLAIEEYGPGLLCAGIAAIGLFIVNATGLAEPVGGSAAPADANKRSSAPTPIRLPLIAITVVASIVAMVMAARETRGLLPLLPWLIGISTLIAAVPDVGPRSYSRRDWVIAGVLLVFALASRTLLLERVPRGIHGDEADWAFWALRIVSGEAQPFSFLWLGYPGTSFVPHSLMLSFFGPTLGAARLGTGLVASLSIPALYLLARQAFDRRIGVIAALFLLLNATDFHFSRMGLPNIEALPVALLGASSLLAVAAHPERLRAWCILGISIGLSLEVYLTALLWPVIAAVILAPTLLNRFRSGSGRAALLGLGVAGFAALVTTAPLLAWATLHPEALGQRASSLTVWSKDGGTHSASAYGLQRGDTAGILKVQLRNTLEALHARGDTSQQFGSERALFDPVCGVGILLGLGVLLSSWRNVASRLLLAWLLLSLVLGGVILVDAPFAPRLVMVLPAGCLIAAVGICQAWASLLDRWTTRRWNATLASGICVLIGGLIGFGYYFDEYARSYPTTRITELARYIQSVQDRYTFYFAGLDEPTDYVLLRFMAPRAEILRWSPGPEVPAGRHAAKVFLMPLRGEPGARAAESVRARYPSHDETFLRDPGGQPVVWVWTVRGG